MAARNIKKKKKKLHPALLAEACEAIYNWPLVSKNWEGVTHTYEGGEGSALE